MSEESTEELLGQEAESSRELKEREKEFSKELVGQEKKLLGELIGKEKHLSRDSSVHAECLNIIEEVNMLLQARLLVGISSILVGYIGLLRIIVNFGSSVTSQIKGDWLEQCHCISI